MGRTDWSVPKIDWTRGLQKLDKLNMLERLLSRESIKLRDVRTSRGNTEEAEENTPMDQGEPTPSIPRNAPELERFDISSRQASPKRIIGEDDMDDESQDKTPRVRSPTISYRTDAESVGSKMDDATIDLLNDIDKKFLSASILGVDITEV